MWYHGGWIRTEMVLPRILDILILQDKTLFYTFEADDIVCWLVNQPIAKLDLLSLPTVAEFVKLTQSIVVEAQRQSADLYKVQLCNRQFFVVSTAIYVVKVYECHPLGIAGSDKLPVR